MQTEIIPLATIYKKDGFINIDYSKNDALAYELFGFLKCLVNKLEDDLTEDLNNK